MNLILLLPLYYLHSLSYIKRKNKRRACVKRMSPGTTISSSHRYLSEKHSSPSNQRNHLAPTVLSTRPIMSDPFGPRYLVCSDFSVKEDPSDDVIYRCFFKTQNGISNSSLFRFYNISQWNLLIFLDNIQGWRFFSRAQEDFDYLFIPTSVLRGNPFYLNPVD